MSVKLQYRFNLRELIGLALPCQLGQASAR